MISTSRTAALAAAAASFVSLPIHSAFAQNIITYCISVKTYTESGSGTDNNIDMTMMNLGPDDQPFSLVNGIFKINPKLKQEKVELKGNHENDQLDNFEHDMPDIGLVRSIILDVDGVLADKWAVNYVRIYRNASCNRTNDADGWTEFAIRKFLDYDPVSFYATRVVEPKITVSPDGAPQINKEYLTLVRYGNNEGSTEQQVMKYKETWSREDMVAITSESVDTLGAAATIGYESPETVYGKLSAEATVSWESAVARAREESTANFTQQEYDWAFQAPPRTFVLRKAKFEVPYADQLYRASNGDKRAIRKVGSQIIPVTEEILEIPKRLADDSIEAVGLASLEHDWFPYMEPGDLEDVRARFLPGWISAGYVVDGNGGGKVAALTSSSGAASAGSSTEDVNGHNVVNVGFADGVFEMTQPSTWVETDKAGAARFTFRELGRDDWSVYLLDESRQVELQLDLYRKMVLYGEAGQPKSDLYPITASSGR